MDARIFYAGNSMLLRLDGLRNERTGELISSGVTVTAKIMDGDEVLVPDSEISLTATGKPGSWAGTFPSTLDLDPGTAGADLRLTVDGGDLLTGFWDIPLRSIRRI